ncbi:hypothetical protein NDA16_000374 [Ustilago loliicola]|nr:hypothetical protein NDA16_000374 [Ustilago loliicola]
MNESTSPLSSNSTSLRYSVLHLLTLLLRLHSVLFENLLTMCIFDDLSPSQSSASTVPEQCEVHFCKPSASVTSETYSNKSSIEIVSSPPAYDSAETSATPALTSTKKNIFTRIFFRSKKTSATKTDQLPSYRETEIAEVWAKIGIDVNDRKQGPRPQCTPDEWVSAMDGLFGAPAPTMSKRRAGEAVVVHAYPGSRGF